MTPFGTRTATRIHPAMRVDRTPLVIAAVSATAICGLIAVTSGGPDSTVDAAVPDSAAIALATPTTVAAVTLPADPSSAGTGAPMPIDPSVTTVPGAVATSEVDLDETEYDPEKGCIIEAERLGYGDSGADVTCLQNALIENGYFSGPVTGQFDQATFAAAEKLQTDRGLFVDGIVGRESAISLGIWPDEQMFVVRTPKPAAGAVDLMGYPLSSVASAGADAPPLPPDSGSGRRLVYYRAGQRVWAVGKDGEIIRSWLVSGSKYNNELPGTHEVYSKSEVSTAWNGKAYLPKMVRWLKTDIGAIGFHGIPTKVSDGSAYQTEDELGQRLSGGCQRQANRDAAFLWDFADIGTKVVVI
jgi:lipoprotein-anchoring transpeptidase ErfK/SrfK